jgi:hypothetical protein
MYIIMEKAIIGACELAEIMSANRGLDVKVSTEHEPGVLQGLFKEYLSRIGTHRFYFVGDAILLDKKILTRGRGWENSIICYKNGRFSEYKPRRINPEKISKKVLLKLYRAAIKYKKINGIFHEYVAETLLSLGWHRGMNPLSINSKGIISGGTTGETDDDINPPEYIRYRREMVDLFLEPNGSWGHHRYWVTN